MTNDEFDDLLDGIDEREEVQLLFNNLKKDLPNLTKLFDKYCDLWYEDSVYRFYHQSYKVYNIQTATREIVAALENLLPGYKLNEYFLLIINDGTDKEFQHEDNLKWLEVTRPVLEAFFHTRYFLEMAIKYGNELDYPYGSGKHA